MIYALGGVTNVTDSSQWTAEVDQYNPTTDTWTRKHDLIIPFANEAALGSDGVIYGFGNSGQCVAYSPSTDSSWMCATDSTGEEGPAVAPAPDGTIYVLGGNLGCGQALATNHRFDPSSNSYVARTPMLAARDYHGAALGSNSRIYIVGGTPGCDGATDTVQEYDPATDTWVNRANFPTARASPGVVGSSDRKLYVLGGNNSSGILATVEVASLP
jgi:N-acetylneuraminic acid mutarotase